jgi:hypothetical protein
VAIAEIDHSHKVNTHTTACATYTRIALLGLGCGASRRWHIRVTCMTATQAGTSMAACCDVATPTYRGRHEAQEADQ